MSILTDADKQLLPLILRANSGFHLGTEWYLRGWKPLWYQYAFHQTQKPNVCMLAGIASGKTTGVAASYLMDCISIPYFRALNTSVTSKQAELPFEMAMGWIEGNDRLEHLVEDIILRPYPTIKFKNFSEYVFRTAGKDARFIRGHEYDRINYDECGLDFFGEATKVLRGRLRGTRVDGTQRMNRLDTISSPTDAPWLVERFYRGWKDSPKHNLRDYLSFRIETYMNERLSRHTIKLMEQEYSDEMIDVELRAKFPDYGLSMFPGSHLKACFDQSLNDALDLALHPEEGKALPDYREESHPRHGTTLFELPYIPGHMYILAADPGTDSPPRRNSAVIFAFDVTVKPARMVYFHWVDGRGSYNPFLASYRYAISKYYPVLKGMDTTGTQKAIDEIAFENHGIAIDGINFQKDKEGMLNSLVSVISNHDFQMPVIKGISNQLSVYSRDKDKQLAQDIVMSLAIAAFLYRHIPNDADSEDYSNLQNNGLAGRRNLRRRTSRNARRR